MTAKISLWRLASLLVVFVMAAGAADAKIHSLSGNVRFQIGDGLPVPIGFTPIPDGKVAAVAGATIRQHGVHAATSPAKVVLDPSQFTHPGTAAVLPVFANNPAVFQVKTAIPFQFPVSKIMFSEDGRTGAAVVTWCPGDVVTGAGNPACASASAGTIPGRMTYTRTTHQFGGPALFATQGVADVALKAGASPPCAIGTNPNCLIIFAIANPNSLGAAGGVFNASAMTLGAAPSPGLFGGTVTAGGIVAGLMTPLGAGLPNPATSIGGPWTTGMLRVEQAAAAGGAETFTFTGSDMRSTAVGNPQASTSSNTPNGTGDLSLVTGAVSARAVSGPNANRGWLNMTVGPRLSHIPLMPAYGMAAVLGLTALSGAYALRRRNRK